MSAVVNRVRMRGRAEGAGGSSRGRVSHEKNKRRSEKVRRRSGREGGRATVSRTSRDQNSDQFDFKVRSSIGRALEGWNFPCHQENPITTI